MIGTKRNRHKKCQMIKEIKLNSEYVLKWKTFLMFGYLQGNKKLAITQRKIFLKSNNAIYSIVHSKTNFSICSTG